MGTAKTDTGKRQSTLENRTIFCGDCLDVLYGFNNNSIDLIYLDPPFNKKKQFTASNDSYAEGATFNDYWSLRDIKNAWLVMIKEEYPDMYSLIELSQSIGGKSNKYYLVYIAMRLLEMKRILKDTGSIYLHCDQTMAHFLKLLMDIIFGHSNFRNEVIWHYRRWTNTSKHLKRMHDTILFYSNGNNMFFNKIEIEPSTGQKRVLEKGYNVNTVKRKNGKITQLLVYKKEIVDRLVKEGKIDLSKYENIIYRDSALIEANDVWEIPYINSQAKERIGYPTQKPISLLERIIKISCPEGGIVLDPFCGCGTTCIASEKLNREWVGIDISKKTFELVNIRLHKEIENSEELFQHKNILIFRDDIPNRTDIESESLADKLENR